MTFHNAAAGPPAPGVAMIGSGLMAKPHTLGYRSVEGVYGSSSFRPRFAVLANAKEPAARSGTPSLGHKRWTIDWPAAITDPDVDTVDANWLHKKIALEAIAAGKRVSCERPIALTAADAQEMCEAAPHADIETLAGSNYLRNPRRVPPRTGETREQ